MNSGGTIPTWFSEDEPCSVPACSAGVTGPVQDAAYYPDVTATGVRLGFRSRSSGSESIGGIAGALLRWMLGSNVALATTHNNARLSHEPQGGKMAQQGSVSESHGSWYVRWWEKIQQEDGSFEWVHPSHRLANKRDYPKKSEVMPLAKEFMDRVARQSRRTRGSPSWISSRTSTSRQ